MPDPRVFEVEGRIQVVETLTRWGAYAGETVRLDGTDLGILLREAFQPGAEPTESFDLGRVRVRLEVLD